jgi:heme oxygenase
MTEIPVEAMRALVCTEEGSRVTTRKVKPVIGVLHRALRTSTLSDHATIDRMLLPFDLNRSEDCRIFLRIHLTALVNLQADWRMQDRDDFEQMIRCIQRDLRTLGSAIATPALLSCTASNPARGLGIAYVIRGSRLGAGVLRRRVVSNLPTSYLDFIPALSWTAFLLELESVAHDPTARSEATRAARDAFNVFAKEFAPFSSVLAMRPL